MSNLRRRLLAGDDGAIMIMGTFMGIGLIGATWYVIGLGDALIYRERVQEAADSGVFSAAAVHAKGMNFIAAINIVLLVLTSLWLILNAIQDVLDLVLDIVGDPGWFDVLHTNRVLPGVGPFSINLTRSTCHPGPTLNLIVQGGTVLSSGSLAAGFCAVSDVVKPITDGVYTARGKYGQVLDKTMPALGNIETVTKNITPAGGFAAGLLAGQQYKSPEGNGEIALTIGAGMIPAGGTAGLGGLPLDQKPFNALCTHAGTSVFDWIKDNVLYNIPLVGNGLKTEPLSKGVDYLKGKFVGGMTERYCSGKKYHEGGPWAEKGFQVVRGIHGNNGSDLYQLWTFVPSTQKDGVNSKRVPMGARGQIGAPPSDTSNTYVAQSEYFFDCDDGWGSAKCNGNDNAMFSIRWKARLKRVMAPKIGSDIADEVNPIIAKKIDDVADAVATGGPVPNIAQDKIVRFLFGKGKGAAQDAVNDVGEAINPDGYSPSLVH